MKHETSLKPNTTANYRPRDIIVIMNLKNEFHIVSIEMQFRYQRLPAFSFVTRQQFPWSQGSKGGVILDLHSQRAIRNAPTVVQMIGHQMFIVRIGCPCFDRHSCLIFCQLRSLTCSDADRGLPDRRDSLHRHTSQNLLHPSRFSRSRWARRPLHT